MRYKIGDTVKVDSYENILSKKMDMFNFTDEMKVFCGKQLTIRKIYENFFENNSNERVYKLEGNFYTWTDEMFVQQNQKNKFDFSELVIEL